MKWQEVLNHPSLQNLPFKIELNEYGKIEMSPASNRHGRIQGRIYSYLEKCGVKGELYLECSIETKKGVKVADVAWGSTSFFEKYGDITPLKLAPEICIEVRSPSNSDAEMTDKIDLYLAKGAKEVWIVDESGNLKIYIHEGMIEQSKLIPTFPKQIKI
jgi:Uma2 family endonuclease